MNRFFRSAFFPLIVIVLLVWLGLRLLRGRLPDPSIDKPGGQQVVVVNQKFVDTFLPGEDPIGQQIKQDKDLRLFAVSPFFVGAMPRYAIRMPALPPRFLGIAPGRTSWIAFTRCRYCLPFTLHSTMSPTLSVEGTTGSTVQSWPDSILPFMEFPLGRN